MENERNGDNWLCREAGVTSEVPIGEIPKKNKLLQTLNLEALGTTEAGVKYRAKNGTYLNIQEPLDHIRTIFYCSKLSDTYSPHKKAEIIEEEYFQKLLLISLEW